MSGLEGLLEGKTLVKRYRIGEVIGRGGMAAVYQADDLRLDRPVAVKVITLPAPDEEMRRQLHARFEREARAAAGLPHHPNLVTVHDFGTDPETGIDFLVMELLRGETLAELLAREGKPPLDTAVCVLRDTAEGLAVGHRAGLLHRDVKPGNIFLAEAHDEDPIRVCVLDYGIARIATDEDEKTITRGAVPLTAAFASPEQLRGERELTPASDVFSLGVVGYQLLTGTKPFSGDGHRGEAEYLALRPVRELAPEVPAAVEDVIRRAMSLAPADRYPDADAFADALDAATGAGGPAIRVAAADPAPAAVAAGAVAAPLEDRTMLQAPLARPTPPVEAPYAAPVRRRGLPVTALLLLLLLGGVVAAAALVMGGGGDDGEASARPRAATGDSLPAVPETGGEAEPAVPLDAGAEPAPGPIGGGEPGGPAPSEPSAPEPSPLPPPP
ncbi:MAG TPA: serine/threonine-protein kinase, partial [Longimicrobiaceae bacterium]|nr:serine/threonine-protein kinase [Longimicrobiaceae bacterium]